MKAPFGLEWRRPRGGTRWHLVAALGDKHAKAICGWWPGKGIEHPHPRAKWLESSETPSGTSHTQPCGACLVEAVGRGLA